ncbi:unnamed protein product [Caenorhabditis brenneri]
MNPKPGKIPKPPNKVTLVQKATFEIITFISVVACLAFFYYSLIIALEILDYWKTLKPNKVGMRYPQSIAYVIKVIVFFPLVTLAGLMNYALWKIVIVPELSTAHSKRTRSLVGPVTIHPIIPFPQDHLPRFRYSKKYNFKNMFPEARIHLDSKPLEERNEILPDPSYISVIDEMNCWMEWIFNLDLKGNFDTIVPNNTRTISIKMDGFKHGRQSHDFEPYRGRAPGSYFSYQMFGENKIQVTNYVVNGVSYIAGFCIYIENPLDSALGYDSEVIEKLMNSVKYPGRSGSREVESQTDPMEEPSGNGEEHEDQASEESPDSLEVGNVEIAENSMEDEGEEDDNSEDSPNSLEVGDVEIAKDVEKPEAHKDGETSPNTENLLEELGTDSEALPEDPEDFDMLEDLKEEGDSWTGYCSKLQTEVNCGFFSGRVFHRQWSDREKRMILAECRECLEDYAK